VDKKGAEVGVVQSEKVTTLNQDMTDQTLLFATRPAFDLSFSLRCRRSVGLRFGVNQPDRAPSSGIFAAYPPVVVLDSPIEVGGYSRV